MRISGLGDYQNPYPGPVVLVDGTVISDPGNTRATQEQCLPYECNAGPPDVPARYWCSYWGFIENRVCLDPSCAPWKHAIPACNLAIAPTPEAPNPPAPPNPPTITPSNIVQPFPSITAATSPVPIPTRDCSFWCVINGAISDNPFVAAGILLGLAVILIPRGRS